MVNIIQGGVAIDDRGRIRFVNDFDMKDIKRFYVVKNADLSLIRGWRAHKIEQRWFYVISGSFSISVVKIDDWNYPNKNLIIEEFTLNSNDNQLLHVPSGYGTALRAKELGSELMIFADHYLDHAQFDDYTFDLSYFVNYKFK